MIELLYDRQHQIIGIRASRADHAVPVRNYRGSMHHISAGAFFTHFTISFGSYRRIAGLVVDGMLQIPLGDK